MTVGELAVREDGSRPRPPRYRSVLAVDVAGSTTRTNPAKARMRRAVYELLEGALCQSGVPQCHRDPLVDRGDGVLALIRPVDEVPKTQLLDSVLPAFARLVRAHNSEHEAHRLRLRAVLHAGEIHYDDWGCYGETLDVAFRLLDAPEVKDTLRRTSSPVTLVVSEEIYDGVVRHGYAGIAGQRFEPLVRVDVAGRAHAGWVLVSGGQAGLRALSIAADR